MDAVNETHVEMENERGEMEKLAIVEEGIDLSDYYPSVEWDIMGTQVRGGKWKINWHKIKFRQPGN